MSCGTGPSFEAIELSLKTHELSLKVHELSSERFSGVRGRRARLPTPRRAPALVVLLLLLSVLTAGTAPAQEIVKRVGRVTFRVDASQAFPGGVVVVRLAARGRLGSAWALLDGRRAPFYTERGVPRALVPVATTAEAGPATLGVGIAARGGEQRIAIPITISARDYRPRNVVLSEEKRSLLERPDATHDGRRLLALLRTESSEPMPGVLMPPVGSTGAGFGEPRLHAGALAVESRTDALQGESHRGLDYAVPAGTAVRSPAAGTVLFAGSLVLTGETLVIDHGQGVVSVLLHLSRIDVRVGDAVTAGAFVALSGDTGLTPEPLLQWRVYLHGVAVDPNALAALL
jgi:murein DD-endopeptidase MepM/ murein hydrolase activator NlpD